MALVQLMFCVSELIAVPQIIARLTLGSTLPTPPNGCYATVPKVSDVSDADTFEAIERHNVLIARRIAEYWRRQGIKTSPTKGPQVKLGPTGLPPGYRGEDAMRLRRL